MHSPARSSPAKRPCLPMRRNFTATGMWRIWAIRFVLCIRAAVDDVYESYLLARPLCACRYRRQQNGSCRSRLHTNRNTAAQRGHLDCALTFHVRPMGKSTTRSCWSVRERWPRQAIYSIPLGARCRRKGNTAALHRHPTMRQKFAQLPECPLPAGTHIT